MTLRTLTKSQEAKFSLIFFGVDRTFSITEKRKLQAKHPGTDKVLGSKVTVKSGKQVFDAEIVCQSNDQRVLEEKLKDRDSEEADSEAASDRREATATEPESESPTAVEEESEQNRTRKTEKPTRKRKRNNNP